MIELNIQKLIIAGISVGCSLRLVCNTIINENTVLYKAR
jgi:hypothetical protein